MSSLEKCPHFRTEVQLHKVIHRGVKWGYRCNVVSLKSLLRRLSETRSDLRWSLRRPNTEEPHLVERAPNEHTCSTRTTGRLREREKVLLLKNRALQNCLCGKIMNTTQFSTTRGLFRFKHSGKKFRDTKSQLQTLFVCCTQCSNRRKNVYR